MAPARPAPDTADRSLAHWSEDGRAEMGSFYELARLDYRLLAGALDWPALLRDVAARRGDEGLTLLDVACGSGKFPQTLLDEPGLRALDPIAYDLLDLSAFSLQEAASVLAPPFAERDRYETTLEELDAAAGPWDLVWATHALYALQPEHLADAVARYVAARAEGGISFLAQGSRDGHYLRIYDAYLEGVRPEGTPYVSSDDIAAELRRQGHDPQVRRLSYDHEIPEARSGVLEGYLQRCLFDDGITLADMRAAPVLGEYLQGCHDAEAGIYRFHHEVDCIVLADHEGALPWRAAS